MICEITTLTIYHHFKSFLNLWRKICNRKSILTSSNCNVKRKCRTLLFVDYLVQFKYSLICYTFPFLMRLNYFAKQFLRNYGRLILKRDSLIHRSIFVPFIHRLLLLGLTRSLNDQMVYLSSHRQVSH